MQLGCPLAIFGTHCVDESLTCPVPVPVRHGIELSRLRRVEPLDFWCLRQRPEQSLRPELRRYLVREYGGDPTIRLTGSHVS